jgi:hypothetical protein
MDRDAAGAQLVEIEAVAATARRCVEGEISVEQGARLGPYPEEVMTSALNRALETA